MEGTEIAPLSFTPFLVPEKYWRLGLFLTIAYNSRDSLVVTYPMPIPRKSLTYQPETGIHSFLLPKEPDACVLPEGMTYPL